MPFLKFDEGALEEIEEEFADVIPEGAERPPTGEFKYEPAEAKFTPHDLEARTLIVFSALKDLGITEMEISYDGGYDEGFAYLDSFFAKGTEKSFDEISATLSQMPVIAATRKAAQAESHQDWLAKYDDAGIAKYLLDDLAHELAAKLLGDGYGTGEYELYGSFRADLLTGKMIDNPNAKKRSGGLGD
jgi:hypothetical protein